ncbi:fimbrial biogenesis chaperone [Stenotrophomonas sepilia]|uniref:fimbrial biogenesis chaperone n=1 Tax=Stenotrophomonas sepilia TaxID=2860290 RepID=UPI002E77D6D8|nr:fimbria/pilus periplasmic chaperone [Stenotrophomonas sepilia]
MRFNRSFLVSLLIGAAFASPSAFAARVSLTPTTLLGEPSTKAHAVTLVNPDDLPVSYQVKAYQWTQQDGKDQLVETSDVLAAPSIVELPPKGRRVVRVMRVSGHGAVGYYRVIFQQLPKPRSEAGTGANVSLLVNHSIPLGFEAAQPDVRLSVSLSPDGSGYRLTNTGTTAARVTTIGSASGASWREGALGWVLPGLSKDIPLKPEHRASALTLTVNGQPVSLAVAP